MDQISRASSEANLGTLPRLLHRQLEEERRSLAFGALEPELAAHLSNEMTTSKPYFQPQSESR